MHEEMGIGQKIAENYSEEFAPETNQFNLVIRFIVRLKRIVLVGEPDFLGEEI